MQQGQIGLYFHWPFCLSKCPYCDFNTHIRPEINHQRWLAAYLRSLDHYAEILPGRVISSVFFGGGTPSLMLPENIAAILERVRKLWPSVNDLEVTLEANPTSVEAAKFEAFRAAGINRVSIGVQALNDSDLKFLGRQHSAAEARGAIEIARKNFDRFSFDLIYARPEQTLDSWRQELADAVEISGGHLSLYQLTIERNTPFHFDHAQGLFSIPKEELAADFYCVTQDVLGEAGLPAYEVSNHAVEGQESRHNLTYWHYGDYIGVGPGAHGRLTLEALKHSTREHQAPDVWLERVEEKGSGAHPFTALDDADQFMECLMMGLRLNEGLPFARLNAHKPWQEMIDVENLDRAQDEGWLDYDDERMILSVEGRLRLNALIPYLLTSSAGSL